MNKVEVTEPDIKHQTSTEAPYNTKKQKFDYYINGLITYPNKLVGKSNLHTVSINGAVIL